MLIIKQKIKHSNIFYSGYAVGSLAGGILYQWFGGSWTFLIYSGLALFCAVSHSIIHIFFLRVPSKPTGKDNKMK